MKKQIFIGLFLALSATSVFAKTALVGDVVQKGNQIVVGGTVSCGAYSIADTTVVDQATKTEADYKLAAQTAQGFTIMGSLDGEDFSINGNPASGSVTFTLSAPADKAHPELRPNRIRSSGDFVKQGVVVLEVSKNGRSISLSCVRLK